MKETFEFLAEGDRFWTWLESDETTAEELESYASTGTIPKKQTQTNYIEHIRTAAKQNGVRTYYNSLTRQFVFSSGEESRTVNREFLEDLKTNEELNKYFKWMVAS